MIETRDLQLLVALARHRHFGRAAAECGISQPAFSMRIRNLEERLKTPIVRRGNRFQGLTQQGETLVARARGVLDGIRAIEEDLTSQTGAVSGGLTVGVIPTAIAFAARLAVQLHRDAPGVVMQIMNASSIAIQQGIEDGTMDAGITYADGASGDLLSLTPLYEEEYVLLAPEAFVAGRDADISWQDAAALPLSLLEQGMQNRRILDRVFADAGAVPQVISETNALTTSLVMAREGEAATVIPRTVVDNLGRFEGTRVLSLVEPEVAKSIVLASSARGPALSTVEALRQTAARLHDNNL